MDDLIKYSGNIPARYTGAEMAVIDAIQNSPKILSMQIIDISVEMSKVLTKAYIDAGFQLPGKETMLILSGSVADDLFTYFKTLSIKEAGLAIQNGIRGEYGEFMGINVKTIHQFCKAYKDSFDRNEVIRKRAMEENQEEKPSQEEINQIMVNACLSAYKQYKLNKTLIDFGGAKFTYLKGIGLINLTNERYTEIFEKAKQQVKAEASETLYKSSQNSTTAEIAKSLLKSTDSHEITRNAARLIALKEYFDFLIENEFELSDFINPTTND